jgi:hypothetical protein
MSKYESPKYHIIKREGSIEIRHYDAFSTTAIGESDLSGYEGFGLLFSYISGNNKPQEKISMTVPVINEFEPNQMTMEFVVPNKYYGNIPEPINPRLITKNYPAHFAAAIIFSWGTSKRRVEKMKLHLQNWLSINNILTAGSFRLARYNPPFSLPFLRTNEIIVSIEYQD